MQETPAIRPLAVRAGNIRLSIFGDADRSAGAGAGAGHLVLGTGDLQQTIRQLESRGVRFAGPPTDAPGFCHVVCTHHPDGNLLEIAQYLRDPPAP